MKRYLLDYGFWLSGSGICCQFLACLALVRRKDFYRQWKVSSYYLFYMAAQSVVSLAILVLASKEVYAFSYYLADFIEAILLNLVVLEIMVKVLEPFQSLPGRTVARFCFWAFLGISTAVAISVMLPVHATGVFYEIPLTVERTIFLADAVLLWVLLVQSKSLGITWKSSQAEIAAGFILYLTVQATTRFAVAMYKGSLLITISGVMGQLAYLIALVGWIWTITHSDPLPARPSAETLARMRELSSDFDAVPKERIFAAVGIKVNRPDPLEVEDGNPQPDDDAEEHRLQPQRVSMK